MEKRNKKSNNRLTRGGAIKKFCVDCSGGSVKEVKNCISYDCPLWRYRKGIEEKD